MSALFTSRRSRLHLVLVSVVGAVLIVAAYDILVAHWISSPPVTDDSGALTSRGQTQRRLDLVWGSVFLVTGVGLVAASVKALLDKSPLAEVTEDGLRLRVLGPSRYLLLPWQDIIDIRSHREVGSGGNRRPVMLVAVRNPGWYPVDLWGAEWQDEWLAVDADQWVEPVEEFVVRANLELERVQREEAAGGSPRPQA